MADNIRMNSFSVFKADKPYQGPGDLGGIVGGYNLLSDKVRAKFPGAYDDMDDQELTQKILAKYPQYSDLALPYDGRITKDGKTVLVRIFRDLKPGERDQATTYIPEDKNIVRNTYDAAKTAALGISAPLLGGIKPLQFLAGAAGSLLGAGAGRTIAEKAGASEFGQELAGDVGGLAGGALGGIGGTKLGNMLPNKARAGTTFREIMASAKTVPTEYSKAGDIALEAKDLSDAGQSLPQVFSKFLRRATDPEKGPITYKEMQDFASNAGKLSVKETLATTGRMKSLVAQFAKETRASAKAAAEAAGKGKEYDSALAEYSAAARNAGRAETARDALYQLMWRSVPWGIGVGAGSYAVRKAIEK